VQVQAGSPSSSGCGSACLRWHDGVHYAFASHRSCRHAVQRAALLGLCLRCRGQGRTCLRLDRLRPFPLRAPVAHGRHVFPRNAPVTHCPVVLLRRHGRAHAQVDPTGQVLGERNQFRRGFWLKVLDSFTHVFPCVLQSRRVNKICFAKAEGGK
jgi:hypothetical protein